MHKYILETAVFVCGAVVMILELAGSRIVAPYFGTSIVVWTSLIGIILGSLSLGYWLGGKFADTDANLKNFSLIIFIASIFTFFIVIIKNPVLSWFGRIDDMRIGAVLTALFLFFPASLFLGMVTPIAVKLKLSDLNTSGRKIGNLYALSTIGSIAGTFAAGFYLIPYFGSTKIIIFLAVLLTACSLLIALKDIKKLKIFFIIILLTFLYLPAENFYFAGAKVIADIDSRYNRLIIYDSTERDSGRPVRNLITDPYGIQSAMYLDYDNELVFDYAKYYFLGEHFNPDFKSSLLIGGGAYSFAKQFLSRYPEKTIDVVEIDPGFTALARKYFNLKDSSRLFIYEQDGRNFIDRTDKRYDIVYLDAFNSALSIPFYLTTEEAVKSLYNILNENGVVLTNLISAVEGDKGMFLRSEYYTYKKIFPHVLIFPTDKKSPERPQNIILIALKSNQIPAMPGKDAELAVFLENNWQEPIKNDLPLLTDEFAPIDRYSMKMFF